MNNKEDIIRFLLDEKESTINNVFQFNQVGYYGPDTRTLLLNGEINTESTGLIISQLMHLNHLEPDACIYLHLNTEGGSLTDALAIYDCISQISSPVLIRVFGLCASAGLIVLSAGDFRVATPNCQFFYHEPIIDGGGINSLKDMNSIANHYTVSKDIAENILLKRSKIKKSLWKKDFEGKTSYWFGSKKALEYKFVDLISKSDKIKFEVVKD